MSTPDLREARKKVLKHPTVEYIPLYPHPIAKGNQKEGRLRLTVIKDPTEYAKLQETLGLKNHWIDLTNSLVVAVMGAEVLEIKYRGFTVVMFARLDPTRYHIFSVTRRYFYKDQLHWQLYDLDGELQVWYNLSL